MPLRVEDPPEPLAPMLSATVHQACAAIVAPLPNAGRRVLLGGQDISPLSSDNGGITWQQAAGLQAGVSEAPFREDVTGLRGGQGHLSLDSPSIPALYGSLRWRLGCLEVRAIDQPQRACP